MQTSFFSSGVRASKSHSNKKTRRKGNALQYFLGTPALSGNMNSQHTWLILSAGSGAPELDLPLGAFLSGLANASSSTGLCLSTAFTVHMRAFCAEILSIVFAENDGAVTAMDAASNSVVFFMNIPPLKNCVDNVLLARYHYGWQLVRVKSLACHLHEWDKGFAGSI
jgi:hypothetical protein